MSIKCETVRKSATARGVFLNGGLELPARDSKQKGDRNMVKRIFSIVAAVAMFSVVALGQGGPAGPMQGPGRQAGMQMQGPMRAGRMSRSHRMGMGPWWMNPAVAERIGLSEQQKQQLEKISQDGRLKMIDLRADLEKQQVILQPMMQAYHPDEAQVLAQVEKVSQARAALEKARVQTMLAGRNVLTGEQWNKLKQTRMPFHHNAGRRGVHRSMMPPAPPAPPSK